jgi:hypothetical protein
LGVQPTFTEVLLKFPASPVAVDLMVYLPATFFNGRLPLDAGIGIPFGS